MPKHNRKSKVNHNNNNNNVESDDDFSEVASVMSYQSDNVASQEEDAVEVIDKYEEKLMAAIENASEKSQQTRTTALQAINEILLNHFIVDFITDRRVTMIDIVERSLKRGKGTEQALAAKMSAILLVQLQGDDELVKVLTPILQNAVLEDSGDKSARAKCCNSLALLFFLGIDDVGDIIRLCQVLEGIFSKSYLKGDNTQNSATPEEGTLHSAALNAWALMLTLIPSGDVVSLIQTKQILSSVKGIMGMLKSQHLDVRTAAGEAIAVLLESGRSHNEDFLDEYLDDLVEITKQLSTDSQKFRAKRDRKQQRATFREIYHYVEEDISPEIVINVGNGANKEKLVLDSWAIHHQYSSVCCVLGSGMNIHLLENDFLRDVFQMQERMGEVSQANAQLTKNEKRALQQANFKARTINRGKNRDKRSAVLN